METLDARLHSFVKAKSRASSKWPHPDSFVANPTSLAEAGFYFKPSKVDPDNVRCFMCKKELSGWEEDDNPFETHVDKCPRCPWAVARCSLEFDVDSHGKFSIKDSARLPTNKVLEKARAETFGGKKWWPHDAVKNHGATSKRMAKAGFVYTPQVEGDDTATCFYCNLSLSGWDIEDDPTEEHIKRVERSGKPCPFFTATEQPKSQASTRSTKSTSRQSRAPKQIEIESDDDDPSTVKAEEKGKQEQEDSEDLKEDDDPSLKVQPGPAPRKSTRKPPSKALESTGKSKQRRAAPSGEEESNVEAGAGPTRSRSKSAKPSTKEQDKDKDKDKGHEKPPSNVDGKIAKPGKDERRARSGSRGRSRSKSKPRSTNARASSLADLQAKPLSRARSGPRISVTTEVADEIETEKMLAEPPSETDAKLEGTAEKALSKARPQTRANKGPTPTLQSFPAPSSPSDFKVVSSKVAETTWKPKEDSGGCSQDVGKTLDAHRPRTPSPMPIPAHQEDGTHKPVSAKTKTEVKTGLGSKHKPSSKQKERDVNGMDVDDEGVTRTEPAAPKTLRALQKETSQRRRSHTLEPTVVSPPRPTTPEDDIIIPNSNTNAAELHSSLHVPPSPADLFIPPLANAPIQTAAALSEEERAMTVEQWIRHEMVVQYERLRADGERRIRAFLEKAEETRRQIEAL